MATPASPIDPGAIPPNNAIPPEYQAQLAELLRQRQMAELYQAQAMQPPQQQFTPGPYGRAVRVNPLEFLAKAMTQYSANKNITAADQGIAGVNQQYANATNQEISQMLRNPDQANAINAGMASTNPKVAALAAILQKQRNEDAQKAGEIAGQGGDTAGGIRIIGSGVIPPNYTGKAPVPPVFSSVQGPAGPIPTVTNTDKYGAQTGHLGSGVNVNVNNAGELKAAEALGGQVPTVLAEARKDALDAQQGLVNSQNILTLASDPQTIAGFAANQQLGLASLGAKFGFTGPEAAAKTQALLSGIAKQTLAASTLLKGSISDKEKPFLEQASSGGINYTPEALQHLAKLSIAVNHNKLINAHEQWQGTISVPGAQAGAAMYPFPPIQHTIPSDPGFQEMPGGRLQYTGGLLGGPPASSPSAMSLDDYLKQNQGRRGM